VGHLKGGFRVHRWTFQGIETGIFVALAAALIAVTAIVLLRRDA